MLSAVGASANGMGEAVVDVVKFPSEILALEVKIWYCY